MWQGKVFSLDPNNKKYGYFYGSLDAGLPAYGDMLGICGINCYHSFSPYIEGSPRADQTGKKSAEENAKQYENQQKQRAYERQLRALKRQQVALKSAGYDDDAKLIQDKINAKSSQYKQFLKDTGLTRNSMLESVRGFNKDPYKYNQANLPNVPRKGVKTIASKLSDKSNQQNIRLQNQQTVNTQATTRTTQTTQVATSPVIYQRNYNSEIAKELGKVNYDKYADLLDKTGNKNIVESYNKIEQSIKVIEDPTIKTSYYEPRQHKIFLQNTNEVVNGNTYQTPYETLFHEMGHAIDYASTGADTRSQTLSVTWQNGKFGKTIKDEMSNLQKSLRQNNKTLEDIIKNKDFRTYANFSDILSGFTDGNFSLGIGHRPDYWKRDSNRKPTEAFAEMCSAYVSNPNSWDFLKKILPQSTKCFEEMIKNIKI